MRAQSNFSFQRLYSQKIDKAAGLKYDQVISLHAYYSKKDYPERLRRIAYYDEKQNKKLVFLTNNFTLPALIITEFYHQCWQIELFFKRRNYEKIRRQTSTNDFVYVNYDTNRMR